MAIYSGFSTRKLQDKYNQLVSDTLSLLSQIIITYVERSKLSPFETQFSKIFKNIQKLDHLKHTEPKFSHLLKPLHHHINLIQQVPEVFEEEKRNYKKRPMTTNNFSQRKKSIQFERKTVNTMPNNLSKSRKQIEKKQRQRYNYSFQESQKPFELVDEPAQTMEELMEKNRLVERKMSAFRKKKYMQQTRIPRIQELEEQNEASFF